MCVVSYTDENGETVNTLFDFGRLKNLFLKLNIDIGASTYWSELMQVQTTDNLFSKGIITDAVTYLEAIPNGYIKNKGDIIKKLKEKQEQDQMLQQAIMGGGLNGTMSDMQNGSVPETIYGNGSGNYYNPDMQESVM